MKAVRQLITLFSIVLLSGLYNAHAGEADTGGGNAWTNDFDQQEMQGAIDRAREILPYSFNYLTIIYGPSTTGTYEGNDKEAYLSKSRNTYETLFSKTQTNIYSTIKNNKAVIKDQCYEKIKGQKKLNPVDGSSFFLIEGQLKRVPGKFCLSFSSLQAGKVDRSDLFVQVLALSAHEYVHLLRPGQDGIHQIAEDVQEYFMLTPSHLLYRDPYETLRNNLIEVNNDLKNVEGKLHYGNIHNLHMDLAQLRVSMAEALTSIPMNDMHFPTKFNDLYFVSFLSSQSVLAHMYSHLRAQINDEEIKEEIKKSGEAGAIYLGNETVKMSFLEWLNRFSVTLSVPSELENSVIIVPAHNDVEALKEAVKNMRKAYDLYMNEFQKTEHLIEK